MGERAAWDIIKTVNFAAFYRDLARAILERELMPHEGIAPARLEAAESQLGFRLPLALREYYRTMGNCAEINAHHDRLIAPEAWEVEAGHLIFLAEHQNVALWSVQVADESDDPLVWQAANDEPLQWFSDGWFERRLCVSEFFWERYNWTFGLGDEVE